MKVIQQHDDRVVPAVIEHTVSKRSFAKTFGLAPSTTVIVIVIDLMLFAGDVVSLGLLVPFSLLAAGALGFVTYKLQRSWGDDHDAAVTKAVIIGLITAIPVPVTPLLAAPAGLIGLIKSLRGK